MGSAALYELSRRGRRVLGLDAFAAGHRQGSSHGESRVIRLAYYEHPNYVPLLRRAYERWADLERESGEHLLRITGGLMIGRPDCPLVAGSRASAVQHGLDFELLDPDEVLRRYPALHLQSDEVALFEPRAGILSPEACVEAHVRLAARSRRHDSLREPVRSWTATDAGVGVVTDASRYTADQVVFTCGARISQVLGDEHIRGCVLSASRCSGFNHWRAAPVSISVVCLSTRDRQADGSHFYGFPHLDWPGVKVARQLTAGRLLRPRLGQSARSMLRTSADCEQPSADRMPALGGAVLSGPGVPVVKNSLDEHFVIDRFPDRHGTWSSRGGSRAMASSSPAWSARSWPTW